MLVFRGVICTIFLEIKGQLVHLFNHISERSGQDSTEWRAVQQSSPKQSAPNVDCERLNGNPTLIHVTNFPPGRHKLRIGGMFVLIGRLMASRGTVDCVDEWHIIWMKYGYQKRISTETSCAASISITLSKQINGPPCWNGMSHLKGNLFRVHTWCGNITNQHKSTSQGFCQPRLQWSSFYISLVLASFSCQFLPP